MYIASLSRCQTKYILIICLCLVCPALADAGACMPDGEKIMTNTKETTGHLPKLSQLGYNPRRAYGPPRNLPIIKPQRRELRPMDATLESRKTRENKRNAVMKNYFESKQLVSFTKHLDAMKTVYFEKMKREKMRVGKSLWELEQRKRKIMRQIYDHPCTDVNNAKNPALFYFTQEKTRRKTRHDKKK